MRLRKNVHVRICEHIFQITAVTHSGSKLNLTEFNLN